MHKKQDLHDQHLTRILSQNVFELPFDLRTEEVVSGVLVSNCI